MNKLEKALDTCEKVLEGIEEETISTSSALLQCLRIARLLNDQNAIVWLQYEYGGYPRAEDGHVQCEAWETACNNGRGYIQDGKQFIFTELASELEEKLGAQQHAVNNFTTQGVSVSGEFAALAMNRLTKTVAQSTGTLISGVATNKKDYLF